MERPEPASQPASTASAETPEPSAFFVTGGTLPPGAASYVARAADEELYQSLRRGEFCYVLNTRQMGKSSLMARAARRLREAGRQALMLDLTGVGQNLSVEQWYFGLLDLVAAQAGHEDELFAFWKSRKELGPMQRFVAALRRILLKSGEREAARDLVVFVDEIDAVRSLPFSADEFFAGIRECYNRSAQDADAGHLTFCLLGVATPSDLIRDTRVTPFNIGRRIELRDFTREEAAPLAEGLRQYPGDARAEALLDRVLHWTGGHPYMTQRLCRAVAESLNAREAGGTGSGKRDEIEDAVLVDTLCQTLFLTKAARETDDNLAFARNWLLHSEEAKTALLDLYGQTLRGKKARDDETNPLCSALRLSGVVKAANGWLVSRNEIYRRVFDLRWIGEHMPDAEVRRQKRAYRLGLLRAAVVAAFLLAVVSGIGARAYFAEQKARTSAKSAQTAQTQAQAETTRSNRLLYATRMNLLQQAYENEDIGRARDLLAETADFPARGFEWNYWNRLLKRERLAIPTPEPQNFKVWSRDGKWIATQTQSTLETPKLSLWDAKTGRLLRVFTGRAEALCGAASPVSADCVALVDAPQGQSGSVRLVNPATGETRQTLPVCAAEATLSGDGGRVFTLEPQADARTRFKVWDVRRGTLLLSTMVSGRQVFGTAVSTATAQSTSDSRLLCFGSAYWRDNCAFTLLDTTTGKRQWVPPGEYNRYALSPQGGFLVATTASGHTEGVYQVWNLRLRRRTAALTAKKPEGFPYAPKDAYFLFTLHFSPDERWIAGGGMDAKRAGKVWIWDSANGKEQRVLPVSRVMATGGEFSADGRWLLASARDNSLRVWNTATWERADVYPDSSLTPVFAPDSSAFLTADGRAALVYPVESRQTAGALDFAGNGFSQLHPDGRHLLTVKDEPGSANQRFARFRYTLHDLNDGTQRNFSVNAVWAAISASGTRAFYGAPSADGGILWATRDALTGRQINSVYDPGDLMSVYFNAGPGMTAVVRDAKRTNNITPQTAHQYHPRVVVWDADGKEAARLPQMPYAPWSARLLYGTQLLVVLDTEHVAHFWQARPLRERFHVALGAAGELPFQYISASSDGKYISLVVSENCMNGRVEVYDAETGRLCARNEHAWIAQTPTAFSPDGRYRIWADWQQNAHIMQGAAGPELRGLKSVGGDFVCSAFSLDGSRVVTGSNTGVIKLWDIETGSELMTVSKRAGEVMSLSFSRDGTRLGAALWTGTESRQLVWDARPLETSAPAP